MEKVITNPINQVQKHQDLKESYGFVKTDDILNAFAAKGWTVATENVANVRKTDKVGYQKHLIRLENSEFPEIPGLNREHQSRPQLCLLNSHDGTTSFRLFLGLIRFACMNGIIAGTALRDVKLVHSKYIMSRVPQSIDFMADAIPQMIQQVQTLSGLKMSQAELTEFVKTCVDTRLQNVNKVLQVNYNSALRVLRPSDTGEDAFTVLNKIQESIIRGGIEYTYERDIKDDDGKVIGSKICHTRTRGLKSVSGQVRLNRLVYDKALEIAA